MPLDIHYVGFITVHTHALYGSLFARATGRSGLQSGNGHRSGGVLLEAPWEGSFLGVGEPLCLDPPELTSVVVIGVI